MQRNKEKRSKSSMNATPAKKSRGAGSPDNAAVFNTLNISNISGFNESFLGDISPSDIYAATSNSGRYCLPFMADTEDKGV